MKRQKIVTTRVWGCSLQIQETPKRWRWLKACPFGKADMDGSCGSCVNYILRGERIQKHDASESIEDAILVEEAVVIALPEPVNPVEPEPKEPA